MDIRVGNLVLLKNFDSASAVLLILASAHDEYFYSDDIKALD